MALSDQLKNQHLLWRAAFGPLARNVNELNDVSQKDLYKLLLQTSSKAPQKISMASGLFDGLVKGVQDLGKLESLSKEQKKAMRKQSVADLKNLNLTWLNEMVDSEAQLREKMSFFWHGHFACRVINIYFQQELLHVIRANALENFGDLLRQVSKSPAMISFLNNQQNKKQHPNENFAREVMELFTMGRGNYSETDVKEAARSFTGWSFTGRGEFIDRPFVHDRGTKTFLGHSGNFDGDDIIDILLEQKQTAIFITRKLLRFFANEATDESKVLSLADHFYQSNYDIKSLLSEIFTNDSFYAEKNIGTRIKSPVELLVGIRRLLPMKLDRPEIQLLIQRGLGQLLFYPPNVGGWPGGKNWIDSSSLLLRMRIPQMLTNASEFAVKTKEDDDTTMGMEENDGKDRRMQINVTVDWKPAEKAFAETPREDLVKKISDFLLQSRSVISPNILKRYVDRQSREAFIKTTFVELMSTPEYQLC